MSSSFHLPNLPREEKLSYIEAQKRKLVEYIKFLDDVAAQHHNEDLPAAFPEAGTSREKRWSGEVVPQFTEEEGFEAVDREDVPGSVASGVKGKEDEVTRRGWFYGWGSAPTTPPAVQ
jgi:hypothetical protein